MTCDETASTHALKEKQLGIASANARFRRFDRCIVWIAAGLLTLPSLALGQAEEETEGETQPPDAAATQPAESGDDPTEVVTPADDRSVEEILRELEAADPVGPQPAAQPGDAAPEDMPAADAAGAAAFDPWLPPQGQLLPEGTYLIARPGRLVFSEEAGVTVFIADPVVPETIAYDVRATTSGARRRPPHRPLDARPGPRRHPPTSLILLPSRVTERIDAAMRTMGESEPIRISGRVYVHEGRNYLLPATNPLRASPVATKPKEGLLREGTYLVSRAARVSRSETGGEWIATFESDSDGHQDPPMILLPCRLLERIVAATQSEGDAAAMTLSGQVYVYRDANYLLPTVMLRPVRSGNLSP